VGSALTAMALLVLKPALDEPKPKVATPAGTPK